MTACVLCGGEIPVGWPVVVLPAGLAHRFKTMCDELPTADAEACRVLELHGLRLGFDFPLQEAIGRAGAMILADGGGNG